MIEIDGAQGEGGGQVLRTALSLFLCTGQPFRAHDIRARRAKPGLMRQHLTAVQATAQIGAARVAGGEIGSTVLTFEPGPVRPGSYGFSVGTAGSTTLVLQTVLPPLLVAGKGASLRLRGGTHNPMAPPFEFLALAFLPFIERMGAPVQATLRRYGFFPAGGGEIELSVAPGGRLAPLHLESRGSLRRTCAQARSTRRCASNAAAPPSASIWPTSCWCPWRSLDRGASPRSSRAAMHAPTSR